MSSTDRARIVTEARTWLGTPYHYRAAVKGAGCDCIGLVNALRAWWTGEPMEEMPAYSPDFAVSTDHDALLEAGRRLLVPRPVGTELTGDVVAFRWKRTQSIAHAGVLASNDRLIHADMRSGVCEVSVQSWRRAGKLAAVFAFPGVQ